MSKYFSFISFMLLFIACNSNTIYKKPKDLIPIDKMVDLLVDMELAIAAYPIKTEGDQKNINFMPFVYEKYSIDSTQFKKSNLYYASRVDEYEIIFNRVKSRLDTMKAQYDLILKKEDSLKK